MTLDDLSDWAVAVIVISCAVCCCVFTFSAYAIARRLSRASTTPVKPVEPVEPVDNQCVIRREIRTLSEDEQMRVATAFETLMCTCESQGEGSLYYQLASIHGGEPYDGDASNDFCAHGRECFGLWHRAYLLLFEQQLRRADVANGFDGNIALPYWDWDQVELNGQCFPKVVRELILSGGQRDLGAIPGFLPAAAAGRPFATGRKSRSFVASSPDEGALRLKLHNMEQDGVLDTAMAQQSHLMFACKRFSELDHDPSTVSLEEPHDNIHGFVGRLMADFGSAFHPIFWLHHCNVDRLYESWMASHGHELARQEMISNQQKLALTTADFAELGFPEGPYGCARRPRHTRTPHTHATHARHTPTHARHTRTPHTHATHARHTRTPPCTRHPHPSRRRWPAQPLERPCRRFTHPCPTYAAGPSVQSAHAPIVPAPLGCATGRTVPSA